MKDWKATVIAQYSNAPSLLRWLEDFNDNIDPSWFYDKFYNKVWNIDTANPYGLNVWGQIVGIDRTLKSLNAPWFGFAEETVLLARPFDEQPDNGAFWDGQYPLYGTLTLDDTLYRQAIVAKAAANISDGSIPSINRFLNILFAGRGKIFVRDHRDMHFDIVTSWVPTPQDASLFMTLGQVLRPAGVTMGFIYQAM